MQDTFFHKMDQLKHDIHIMHTNINSLQKQEDQTIHDHTDLKESTLSTLAVTHSNHPNFAASATATHLSLSDHEDETHLHTEDYQHTVPSTKPPVFFDMAKWRKEIKHITVNDEEFQIMECWYVDVSQCISLSTKEPVYLPDLLDLSVQTQFRPLFGGYTTSTIKEAGDEHYNRLSYALRCHILHTNLGIPQNVLKSCKNYKAL